jgi:hypothetical protein
MASRKKERQLAAAREMERRRYAAAESSPLSRTQLDGLWLHVANQIARSGHDGELTLTRNWLTSNEHPIDETVEFLSQHRMNNDFDVLYHCDPNELFGTANERRRRMPIDRQHLNELLDYLDRNIPTAGCDHSTKLTEQWLNDRELPTILTVMACLALGGGCDCEIAMNVEIESVFGG